MNPPTRSLPSSTIFHLISLFSLIFLASLSSGQNTYEGCYALDNTLVMNDTSIYQSKGRCDNLICSPQNYAVFGMTGDQCYCGNSIPAQQVTGNFCNRQCPGYPNDTCGGTGYLSVWLSGVGNLVGSAATQILSATTTAGSSATAASNTVIYITTGQSTVTATPTAANSSSAASGGSGVSGGTAAGIAIAVLGTLGIALGAFIYIRRRKKQQDYQKTYESGLGSSPGSLNRPFAPDQRLEPGMVQKRESVGSLADEQDYSRKILRVTNPDGN